MDKRSIVSIVGCVLCGIWILAIAVCCVVKPVKVSAKIPLADRETAAYNAVYK